MFLSLIQVVYPRQVQNSSHRSYVSAAAGLHHSLLVDNQGIVYSFGDGRHGQLGYGNEFTPVPTKGGKLQVFPRQVNPSGNIKEGRDLKMVQVCSIINNASYGVVSFCFYHLRLL